MNQPLAGRAAADVHTAVHCEALLTTATVHVPEIWPCEEIKLTTVPAGIGLPMRSDNNTVMVAWTPWMIEEPPGEASRLRADAAMDERNCVGRPLVTAKPTDVAVRLLLDAAVAVINTGVGKVPEATLIDTYPFWSVVNVCTLFELTPLTTKLTPALTD